MTLEEEVAALKLEVAALRKEMGPVVDEGAAPVHERIVQLGEATNGVVARCEGIPGDTGAIKTYIDSRLGSTPPNPAPVVVPVPTPPPSPAPSAGTIPPLSAASIASVIAAMTACSQGYDWQPAFLVRVKTELGTGKYSYVDKAFIDALNVYYYSTCVQGTPAYRDAINGYLTIVDQRIPGTDTLYPAGDPKIKLVSGSAVPAPAPSTTPTPSLGGGLVHIGGSASSLTAEQNYAQAMVSVSAGDISSGLGGDAAILFTARSPIVSHIMYATGGDKGWRFWYNMKPVGPNSLAASDPTLGQIAHQYEKDGSVSWTYFRPQNTPKGPTYDDLPGKSLTIYPGGFNTAQTGKYTDIFGGQAGRGIRIGLTLSGSNNPTTMFQLDPDGTVSVMIGGALRTLKVSGNQVTV